jgi:hypothetical protein
MDNDLWTREEEEYLRSNGWTQSLGYWLHHSLTGGLVREEAVKMQRRWDEREKRQDGRE